jgi:hypothetical protein
MKGKQWPAMLVRWAVPAVVAFAALFGFVSPNAWLWG